jgi:hypothetical protein
MRNGVKTIVHTVSVMMDEHPDCVFFQTDLSNA